MVMNLLLIFLRDLSVSAWVLFSDRPEPGSGREGSLEPGCPFSRSQSKMSPLAWFCSSFHVFSFLTLSLAKDGTGGTQQSVCACACVCMRACARVCVCVCAGWFREEIGAESGKRIASSQDA